MKIRYAKIVIGLVLLIFSFSCQESDNSGHPRILLLDGEEQAIQKQVKSSETWGKMHQAIIAESENILQLAPQERIQIGRGY